MVSGDEVLTLDVGCGTLPKGDINVDVDKKRYIKQWRKNMPKNLILADAKHLPFPNNTFTHTYCMVALPYMGNEIQAVKEIARTLKPNGTFSVSHHLLPIYIKYLFIYIKQNLTKDILYPFYRILDLIGKIYAHIFLQNRQPNHLPRMSMFTTPKALTHLLTHNGFTLLGMQTRGSWMRMDQWIDAKARKRRIHENE